jgi:hypothetical protein
MHQQMPTTARRDTNQSQPQRQRPNHAQQHLCHLLIHQFTLAVPIGQQIICAAAVTPHAANMLRMVMLAVATTRTVVLMSEYEDMRRPGPLDDELRD